jgi:predicted nucleotidyltransferase component of viral defense system
LKFRGGTALNKLHFPKPLRYSEDIDLVRTTDGAIGPVLDRVRDLLTPWLGRPSVKLTDIAPKMRFRVNAEDGTPISLKLEINTRERTTYDGSVSMPFSVENPWFAGAADIPTFSNEELLATKLRALLQRNKGRDLVDLAHALDVIKGLDPARTVDLFGRYLDATDTKISRAMAEERMFAKLERPAFMADVRPLLTADEAEGFDDAAARAAFAKVFTRFIQPIPGQASSKTDDLIERHALDIPSRT